MHRASKACTCGGGKVARGGLRWSDRREDFRTEVLGLMKAQMVKNTGDRAGRLERRLCRQKSAPGGRSRGPMLGRVIACYQMFLRGLLDVTDNLVAGVIAPPPDAVRHDGDDPYLVVAADKGTATFSDYANAHRARIWFLARRRVRLRPAP